MAIANFSKEAQLKNAGAFDDYDHPESNDTRHEEKINKVAWRKFLSYYRYFVDEFIIKHLGVNLFDFQRVIVRGLAKNQNGIVITCRGLTKSWLIAIFAIAMAILYPGINIGIASGNFRQAKNVIVKKIGGGGFIRNENIRREIKGTIKNMNDDCYVEFKNGSEIRAISVDQRMGGEGAESWRFQILIVDEAKRVKDDIIEKTLIPMTKTPRDIVVQDKRRLGPEISKKIPYEKSKVIMISSAPLKLNPLYTRFKHSFSRMVAGESCFVCALDYKPGVRAGILDEADVLAEKEKPSMTEDMWLMQYGAVFSGSTKDSYYPYEITAPCRVGKRAEMEQPKGATSRYIITHDVALSDNRGTDNVCTHVIKLRETAGGKLKKSIVFTKVMSGASLPEQRDYLRELVHIRFRNAVGLVIDARGSGEALPSLFCESWEWIDQSTGKAIEFPPIVGVSDTDALSRMPGAMNILHAITATNDFNTRFYPYLKACLQDRSLELLSASDEVDKEWKEGRMTEEEYLVHLEHDALMSELSNIKETVSEHGNVIYDRIVKSRKRDRATSLVYGMGVVHELEIESKERALGNKRSDYEYASLSGTI